MANKFLNRKGQAALETAIAFVVLIFLLAGITKIWFWMNEQIVRRQMGYNASRQEAGIVSDTYTMSATWPLKDEFVTRNLTENDVFPIEE